ncbi:hypothetical protein [Candidatus Kryptobacter tengchongensis]|uniref:Uncharacterized protein n=1 Tax=Kryptobacter tengchongensis TaxID=1643429 RepID=A0A656DC82_KRYT1|nr:hypothetical protein [Candidatus Kryptobacter tengchongensis]CUT05023.1 hypothetical protein JGI24_01607 [Candidatus Kryptobacter tengchongensis]
MKRWILTIVFIFSLLFGNILLSREPELDGIGMKGDGGSSGKLWTRIDEICQKSTTYYISIGGMLVTVTEVKQGWRTRCISGGNEQCLATGCITN